MKPLYEADLQKIYKDLVCADIDEIYAPNLMKLRADLESEGHTLEEAMKRSYSNPIVLKTDTIVYNSRLK